MTYSNSTLKKEAKAAWATIHRTAQWPRDRLVGETHVEEPREGGENKEIKIIHPVFPL